MIERFTASARLSLSFAGYESFAESRSDISPSHLLLAIMYLYPAILARVVRSREELRVLRQRLVEAPSQPAGHVAANKEFQLDDESRRILLSAGREARAVWKSSMPFRRRLSASVRDGRWHVDPHHILLGILDERSSISATLLMEFGASLEAVRGMIGHSHAPTTVEPSTVNSLIVVTGEFVDSDLERESRAQLSRFLGPETVRYTRALYLAILGACYEATRLGADALGVEHLLPGFFAGSVVDLRGKQAIEGALGPIRQIRGVIGPNTSVSLTPEQLSAQARAVLTYAGEEATHLGHREIGTGHLLLGLLRFNHFAAAEHLRQRGIDLGSMRSRLSAPDFL